MAAAATRTTAEPAELRELVDRYDPEVIDLPPGPVRIRLEVEGGDAWDAVLRGKKIRLERAKEELEPDALLAADAGAWRRIAADVRGGMEIFRAHRLSIRRNLHLGVGFLAATSGNQQPGRLTFKTLSSKKGRISIVEAGVGDPVLCLHGLGGTKASFLPTLSALADSHRVIAMDFPGFGDSTKPIAAPYNAAYFARSAFRALDALDMDRAHIVGNSMGGRVAIEAGLMDPSRVEKIVLLSPALAWLRDRRWTAIVKALRPELGLLQLAPRQAVEGIVRRIVPGGRDGWSAAGVDEFLRAYFDPRGRAAFYAAARAIYLDEPHGDDGFWTRLAELSPDAMFVWGKQDNLVPIAFMRHVEEKLPAARHVELDCGHVPQLERPRETHAAMRKFLKTR
jgi:pimeloyl-ACP methyl ester carboxylesterase